MEELERRVDRQDFATALERERQQATGHDSTAPTGSEVLQADWWQPASNEGSDTLGKRRQVLISSTSSACHIAPDPRSSVKCFILL